MDELAAFVRRCVDRDEQVAREAADYGAEWSFPEYAEGIYPSDQSRHPGMIVTGAYGGLDDQYAEHIARWDPARVLAEAEAKRRILTHIGMVVISPGREALPAEYVEQMELFLRTIAQPYAGQDGWREEWRLDGS